MLFYRLQNSNQLLLSDELLERIEYEAIVDAQIKVQWSRYDAIGRDGEESVMDVMQRIAINGTAIVGIRQQMVAIDDADGAGIDSSVSLMRENATNEWPISIEEAARMGVYDVLQYCKKCPRAVPIRR